MQVKVADMVVALNSSRAYLYAMARACDTGRRSNTSLRELQPNSSESRNPRVVTSAARAVHLEHRVDDQRGAVTEQRRLAKIDPDLVDLRRDPVERAGIRGERLAIAYPPRPRVIGRKVREPPQYPLRYISPYSLRSVCLLFF